MRGAQRLLVLPLLVGAALAVGTAPASASSRLRPCRGGFNVNGDYQTRDFWRSFSERGTTCSTALRIGHRFVLDTGGDPSSLVGVPVRYGVWLCMLRMKQGRDNPYGVVTCGASRHRLIVFYGAS